jgi:hypothetical protein
MSLISGDNSSIHYNESVNTSVNATEENINQSTGNAPDHNESNNGPVVPTNEKSNNIENVTEENNTENG